MTKISKKSNEDLVNELVVLKSHLPARYNTYLAIKKEVLKRMNKKC